MMGLELRNICIISLVNRCNEFSFENAQHRIEYLESSGVFGSAKSFKEIVDVNMTALHRLK